MNLPSPNPDLMRSLARLVRGLSALFWGLPIALLVGVYTARATWLQPYGFVPPLLANAWLLFGLSQMTHFQPQERVWIEVVDRARLLALVLIGFCPFLYWWNKAPDQIQYTMSVLFLAGVGLLFLSTVNLLLRRLSAMLPDETLRMETNHFTTMNRGLLLGTMMLLAVYCAVRQVPDLPLNIIYVLVVVERMWLWLGVALILLPLAMTMALLWKTKEVILDSIFNRPSS